MIIDNGEWKMEDGELRIEPRMNTDKRNGKWKMEDGRWEMEDGKLCFVVNQYNSFLNSGFLFVVV